jgi:hypothetical protein
MDRDEDGVVSESEIAAPPQRQGADFQMEVMPAAPVPDGYH